MRETQRWPPIWMFFLLLSSCVAKTIPTQPPKTTTPSATNSSTTAANATTRPVEDKGERKLPLRVAISKRVTVEVNRFCCSSWIPLAIPSIPSRVWTAPPGSPARSTPLSASRPTPSWFLTSWAKRGTFVRNGKGSEVPPYGDSDQLLVIGGTNAAGEAVETVTGFHGDLSTVISRCNCAKDWATDRFAGGGEGCPEAEERTGSVLQSTGFVAECKCTAWGWVMQK